MCVPFNPNLKGRLGGNPPVVIESLIPENYIFYATLIHPKKENSMLSILIHESFDTRIDNNIYPEIVVKVIEHEYSEQGSLENKRAHGMSMHSISDYDEEVDDKDFFLVKAGGAPRLIQFNDYYYKDLNYNHSYLLQIDEEGYSNDLVADNYPFNYGALYLYEENETNEVIAGFWQYS